MPVNLRSATFADLDTTTLYALLKLRAEVFVVEQECAYLDPDGRDTEPGTQHVWIEHAGAPVAYLRILEDVKDKDDVKGREDHRGGRARIGRVVVAPSARGAGHAGTLVARALELIGDRPSTLDAQAHLVEFYARFGFQVSGPEYVEDGIPHVPMDR